MDKQVAKINSAGALASLNLRADSGKGAEEIKSEDVSTPILKILHQLSPECIGKFVVTQGEYDEEGVEIVAPTYTEGYALDVVWHNREESPYGWKSYEKEPQTPSHKLLGDV